MKLQNPWQPSVLLSAKIATKFENVINEDTRTLKDALEKLNTRKSTRTKKGSNTYFVKYFLKILNLSQFES